MRKFSRNIRLAGLEEIAEDIDLRPIEEEIAWEDLRDQKDKLEDDKTRRLRTQEKGWEKNPNSIPEVHHWIYKGLNLRKNFEIIHDIIIDKMEDLESEERAGELEKELTPSDLIEYFVAANKDVLDKFVVRGKYPKYLGSGAFGDAWELPTLGLVLKIYRPAFEPHDIWQGTAYNNTPFAEQFPMLHRKGALKLPANNIPPNLKNFAKEVIIKYGKLHYIVIEKFDPIPDSPQFNKIFKDLTDDLYMIDEDLDENSQFGREYMKLNNYLEDETIPIDLKTQMLSSPKSIDVFEELKSIIYSLFKYNAQHIVGKRSIEFVQEQLDLPDDWLEQFAGQCAIRMILGEIDLHPGNLGVRPSTGTLIYFDG